ncbi:histidinol phosphate aminotransferase [Pseudooceanicola sp. 502str34]
MHDSYPDSSHVSAPDYTTATLWMGFINLLWILGVISALWGLPGLLLAGLGLNHLITLLDRRRSARG